jgi:hypothetical protein
MTQNEITPAVWGPYMWKLLYTLADHIGKNHDNSEKEAELITFIVGNLGTVLPCVECQVHFKQYYIKNPFDTKWLLLKGDTLRYTVMKWLWELQNYIRTIQNKHIMVQTVEIAINLYRDYIIPVDEFNYIRMCIDSATNKGMVHPAYRDDWWRTVKELTSLLKLGR